MNRDLIQKAINARTPMLDADHQSACRLFNGFIEGDPSLAIDLYARTIVIHAYGLIDTGPIQNLLLDHFSWLKAILVKIRNGSSHDKRGRLIFGSGPDDRIREHGVWYALDLTMNRDSSFYLDTRNLRKWAIENLKDKTVLNSFAYTGSLGVAAMAGGAKRVVQLDRNRKFLNLAQASYKINTFSIHPKDFQANDFFPAVGQFKHDQITFDCVFLDPPFFSTTGKGNVDLENDPARLINKVRPLINDGGTLVAINNALFLSGVDTMRSLESLCKDGYLTIESFIEIPPDFTGFPETRLGSPPVDPFPFNHSTKISVLRVRKKG